MDKLKNGVKFIWNNIPLLAIALGYAYILFQALLFLIHKVLPLFTPLTGIGEFLNGLPYAFQPTEFLIAVAKTGMIFVLAKVITKTYDWYNEDMYKRGYALLSYIGAAFITAFLVICFNDILFKKICSIIALALCAVIAILFFKAAGDSCDNSSTTSSYKPQTKQSTSTPNYEKTYKFEQVRQLPNQVTAVRTEYVNGQRRNSGTTFNALGKLISASGDQIIVEYGNHWQTYDVKTGYRISSVPKPRN